MTDLEDIRAGIVATLRGIDGIGVVHSYQRYAHAMDKLKALYVPAGETQLRGWFVTRIATDETSGGQRGRLETVTWRIQGVMAVDDAAASETAFDGLIEAIRDAFRAVPVALKGLVLDQVAAGDSAGVQVLDAGPVMFANVLCHGARLALTTRRLLVA